MKTKLNKKETLVAEWIFDGNYASVFLEPNETYFNTSFETMFEGAKLLESRELVELVKCPNGVDVIATSAWLEAEGLAA